jgi:benzoylformate decarboxylase
MTTRRIADGVMDILRDWSVTDIFICPGSTEAAVLDATIDRDDIRAILVTHDSVAVSMADGFARASGKPGVAYLHANVGLTNGLSHLASAFAANSPVVLLNGLKSQPLQYRGGFTTSPHMSDFVRDYVKWDAQPAVPDSVYSVVTHALSRAMREPQGPVWVGLAEDVIEGVEVTAPENSQRFRQELASTADPDALDRAAQALAAARRPVIVAGSDVAKHGATAELLTLADLLNAPVLNEDRRSLQRIAIPTDHPRFGGNYSRRNPHILAADVVFFVGARCFVEFIVDDIPMMPDDATIIHSHVDPAIVGALYGADIPLVGDDRLVLSGLADRLREAPPRSPGALGSDLVTPPQAPQLARALRSPGADDDAAGYPDRRDAIDVIAEAMDDDTVFVCDAVTATQHLLDRLPLRSADSFHASTSGSLGWGVGAALGVKLAHPDRAVVAFFGDGAFQFGIQGLWTAAKYEIDVTFVVLNNQAFAAVGAALRRYRGPSNERQEYPGTDLRGPNLAEISRGFGIESHRVESLDELRAVLAETRSHPGPRVIEVMTQQYDWIDA